MSHLKIYMRDEKVVSPKRAKGFEDRDGSRTVGSCRTTGKFLTSQIFGPEFLHLGKAWK